MGWADTEGWDTKGWAMGTEGLVDTEGWAMGTAGWVEGWAMGTGGWAMGASFTSLEVDLDLDLFLPAEDDFVDEDLPRGDSPELFFSDLGLGWPLLFLGDFGRLSSFGLEGFRLLGDKVRLTSSVWVTTVWGVPEGFERTKVVSSSMVPRLPEVLGALEGFVWV
jgi:hypothetical protein